ncbi:hypothetical protein GOBAR_DD25538 [Gossypium barbadense]|nr:hypothetical protein GOBAR_DD25538 [Gossypium barbadense]
MEEPQAIPPWVQEKGVTLTSATPMSEEMAECIKAYLKYNTGCNYEYRKLMMNLIMIGVGTRNVRCLHGKVTEYMKREYMRNGKLWRSKDFS